MSDKVHLYHCRECGVPLDYVGTGRPPSLCSAHMTPQNRIKHHVAQHRREHGGGKEEPCPARDAERLAVGLSLTDDPEDAARLVGLKPSRLPEVLERAKKHGDLIHQEPSGTARIIYATLNLALLEARNKISQLTSFQAGQTSRTLAQCLEILQGGASHTFGDVELIIEQAKEDANQSKVESPPKAG